MFSTQLPFIFMSSAILSETAATRHEWENVYGFLASSTVITVSMQSWRDIISP